MDVGSPEDSTQQSSHRGHSLHCKTESGELIGIGRMKERTGLQGSAVAVKDSLWGGQAYSPAVACALHVLEPGLILVPLAL